MYEIVNSTDEFVTIGWNSGVTPIRIRASVYASAIHSVPPANRVSMRPEILAMTTKLVWDLHW